MVAVHEIIVQDLLLFSFKILVLTSTGHEGLEEHNGGARQAETLTLV